MTERGMQRPLFDVRGAGEPVPVQGTMRQPVLGLLAELNERYELNRGLCADCRRADVRRPAEGRACPGPSEIGGRDARAVCACGCHDW